MKEDEANTWLFVLERVSRAYNMRSCAGNLIVRNRGEAPEALPAAQPFLTAVAKTYSQYGFPFFHSCITLGFIRSSISSCS